MCKMIINTLINGLNKINVKHFISYSRIISFKVSNNFSIIWIVEIKNISATHCYTSQILTYIYSAIR